MTAHEGTFLCQAENHNVCASQHTSHCPCPCHTQTIRQHDANTVQEAVTRLAWQLWVNANISADITDETLGNLLHQTLTHYNGEGHYTLITQKQAFTSTVRAITAHPTWWSQQEFLKLYKKNLYNPSF